jgi:hypothetical protein
VAHSFIQRNANESEIDKLKEFLKKRSFINENGCKIWDGGVDRDQYGVARVTINSKRIGFAAHRLMFYVSLEGKTCLDPTMHVSHICHKKLCINIHHLSYEPPIINNNRMVC